MRLSCVLFCLIAYCSIVNSEYKRPNIQSSVSPSLGGGFNDDAGIPLTKRVEGDIVYHGSSQAEWKAHSNLSSAKRELIIQGKAEVSMNFSCFSVEGGIDINHVNKKTNHTISETLYYDLVGARAQLNNPTITENFQDKIGHANASQIFGSSFINSVQLGGRLVIDINIKFSNKLDSTKVNGRLGVNVLKFIKGIAEAKGKTLEALEESEITVRAKQIGGNPAKLSTIFNGGEALVKCGGGEYERCSEVIMQIVEYGAEFGEQLNAFRYDPEKSIKAAVIGFSTIPYENEGLNVFPGQSPIINREIARRQKELTKEYFRLIEDIKFCDEKLAEGWNIDELDEIRNAIDENIELLVEAIQNSYDYPGNTVDNYQNYRNQKINYTDPEEISFPRHTDEEMRHLMDNASSSLRHNDEHMRNLIRQVNQT